MEQGILHTSILKSEHSWSPCWGAVRTGEPLVVSRQLQKSLLNIDLKWMIYWEKLQIHGFACSRPLAQFPAERFSTGRNCERPLRDKLVQNKGLSEWTKEAMVDQWAKSVDGSTTSLCLSLSGRTHVQTRAMPVKGLRWNILTQEP